MVSPAGCGIVTFVAEASLTSFSEQALVALTYNPSVQKGAVIQTIKVASNLLFLPSMEIL
jgi:hypothetical protein